MTKEKLKQLNGFTKQFYDLEADIEHLKKCTINIPSVFTDGILFRLNTESSDLQKKISSKLSGLYLDLTILIEKELKEKTAEFEQM